MGHEALIESLDPGELSPPRVSVVIPVRNRADLLQHTLVALAGQTLTDHEVIVVDDGSTDGSADVARSAAASGQRVRVISTEGRGAVAARSTGVDAAASEFLAFTDSDCVPDPGWLEAGVAALDAGADVVQGYTEPVRPPRPLERSLWSVRDDGLFATCNVFYRRAAFERAGGFDGTAGDRLGFRHGAVLRDLGFGEDTLLGWRVRRSGPAVWIRDAVVRHAVLPVDVRESFRRAWQAGGFPMLVREVPELRRTMRPDMVRQRSARMPLYVGVVTLLLGRRRVSAAAGAIWVGSRWRRLAASEPSLRRRSKVLPLDLALEAVSAAALVWGSICARRPVL